MNVLHVLLVGWLLLLPACRYTFLPLDPGRATLPERFSVSGSLETIERGAIARLTVRRMAEPAYLELRWYKGDQLFQERSIWVEKPGTYQAQFERLDDGYYRLVVLVQNSPLLQLEVGSPLLPPPPTPQGFIPPQLAKAPEES